MVNTSEKIILSVIVSSRNDSYGGNSLWRLQSTINVFAKNAHKTDLFNRVEILISDWGSETPLKEVLQLSAQALIITRFIEIPPSIVDQVSKDAPFAEVFPNNAAIRRARGQYIGRLDQDTLVSATFLQSFIELTKSKKHKEALSSSFLFSRRRSIPLAISQASWSFNSLDHFTEKKGQVLPIEGRFQEPWFDAPVGILVMHRTLWQACKGYNENLIYWGFMDAELGIRVQLKHKAVNLEQLIGCHFYHQRHSSFSFTKTPRIKNERSAPNNLAVNDDNWGLNDSGLTPIAASSSTVFSDEPLSHYSSTNKLLLLFWILRENSWELFLTTLRGVLGLFKFTPFALEKKYKATLKRINS